MKKGYLLLTSIAMGTMLASCGGGKTEQSSEQGEKPAATEAKAEKVTWKVDTEASNVRWEGGTAGAKVYSHYGDINLKSGMMTTEGDRIVDGKFTVDMTTIQPKDDNYTEDSPREKLVGHLSSDDFFLVEEYPTATFKVKSMEGTTLTGDLTVRGSTHEETVNIEKMDVSPDGSTMSANGKLIFDRQKYDVKWEHFLQDVTLSDDIELEITLVAKKA